MTFNVDFTAPPKRMSMLLIVDMKEAGMTFAPKELRYIKLGPSGAWARAAVRDGTLPFGFREAPHEACMAGDWEGVRTALSAAGRSQAAITQDLREIRAFYELGPDALWVTFCDGRLFWCFAEAGVEEPADDQGGALPSRMRKVIDGWSSNTIKGNALGSGAISSSITSVSGYRRTICKIAVEEQLLRLIHGELNPLQADLARINEDLRNLVVRMVRELDWRDFETLVDLIFARGGWRRTSLLGGTMADIDLALDQAITGERAYVQVKSRATQATLNSCLATFAHNGLYDRFFFVCHQPQGTLQLAANDRNHLWLSDTIADHVIEQGLVNWLAERVV